MENKKRQMQYIVAMVSVRAVLRTGFLGLAYILLDALTIACTFGFTLAVGGYFGYEPFKSHQDLLAGFSDKAQVYLIIALVLSITAVLARLGQSISIARITVGQEMWYAKKMRRVRPVSIRGTVVVRASNHYGRFAAASVLMFSAAALIFGTIFVALTLLPATTRWLLLVTLILAVILLFAVFRGLARLMAKSSRDLVHHARHTALWKTGAAFGVGDVRLYTGAYFRRLFLAGLFGLAPMIFAAFATLLLMVLKANNITIDLATVFVGFIVARAYLGLVGRLFDQGMRLAAYTPAVFAVWTTLDSPEQEDRVASGQSKTKKSKIVELDDMDT